MIPICVKSFWGNKTLLGVANAFSGGLFLAAGICHILPEANEQVTEYLGKEAFPWAFFSATMSFSLVLLIDKVVFKTSHSHGDDDDPVEIERTRSIYKSIGVPEELLNKRYTINNKDKSVIEIDVKDLWNDNNQDPNALENNFKEVVSSKNQLALRASQINLWASMLSAKKSRAQSMIKNTETLKKYSNMDKKSKNNLDEKLVTTTNSDTHSDINENRQVKVVDAISEEDESTVKIPFSMAPYLLALAMGIHAAFAGLA